LIDNFDKTFVIKFHKKDLFLGYTRYNYIIVDLFLKILHLYQIINKHIR